MAPSYDRMAAMLLCAEDNAAALGDDDVVGGGDDGRSEASNLEKRGDLCGFSGGFPLPTEECVRSLVGGEASHAPAAGYADRLRAPNLAAARRDAVDWIGKVHAYFNFGPRSAALSVNYLDRFLSLYELPEGNAWMTQLLSVACLSLAAKMEESVVPPPLELQVGDAKYVFEARTIQRMELLVLSTLKWKMHAVTPFAFIDYFLHKFGDGDGPSAVSLSMAADLVLNTAKGTDFLNFKPSEVAAAIALAVLEDLKAIEVEKAVIDLLHVEKDGVLHCYRVIQDKIMPNRQLKASGLSVFSAPQSPIGVLDNSCLSHSSDDVTDGSNVMCYETSPATKRRRISR